MLNEHRKKRNYATNIRQKITKKLAQIAESYKHKTYKYDN